MDKVTKKKDLEGRKTLWVLNKGAFWLEECPLTPETMERANTFFLPTPGKGEKRMCKVESQGDGQKTSVQGD